MPDSSSFTLVRQGKPKKISVGEQKYWNGIFPLKIDPGQKKKESNIVVGFS